MTTKSEWLEITIEVPAEAVDFSDCGDGCGEVYGLRCAKLKVGTRYGTEMLPVLEFADGPRATQLMHEWLGTDRPDPDELDEASRNLARMAAEVREVARRVWQKRMECIAEQERQAHFDDPLSKRGA